MRIQSEFRWIYSHFCEFLTKILKIFLKYGKIVNNNTVDFIFRDKINLVAYFDIIFSAKILSKYFKIEPFSSKTARNKPF